MRLSEAVLQPAEERGQAARAKAVEVAIRHESVGAAELARMTAIPDTTGMRVSPVVTRSAANVSARRANLRFAGAKPTRTELERTIGTNDLVDEFYLERALAAARPVCRLIVRTGTGKVEGYATGVMVSPDLLLTNWHVFPTAADAANSLAEFDYTLDIRGDDVPSHQFRLDPGVFFDSNENLDVALVAVIPRGADGTDISRYGFHRLSADPNKIDEGEWITIIQHPGGLRRQYAVRENHLFDVQPQFLWYQSDTAPGSSGSPCFNDSFQIVALHHSGKAKQENGMYVLRDGRRVASLDGIDDSLVTWEANEGIRISVLCNYLKQTHAGDPLIQRMLTDDGTDVMTRAVGGKELDLAAKSVNDSTPALLRSTGTARGSMLIPAVQMAVRNLTIQQLTITSTSGDAPPRRDVVASAPASARTTTSMASTPTVPEKLKQPIVDGNYGNRQGYDDQYLGVSVPLPKVTNASLVAKTDTGKAELPYEHFSVVMNKERRLALFTASNVDGRAKSRTPDTGSFSRKALTGLGPNDQEQWITDPRIPEQHQLPDVFFSKDGGAFDKGHIVRREDVCWGTTRSQIVRANGDTFHTTNCSPQVADFNRSNLQGIWGELENYVLDQAKTETYSLFAGPVLMDDDEWFEGRDERGAVRVQIPKKFWKVVMARKNGQLQAYAFVLEQDLSAVPLDAREFQVNAEWKPYLVAVDELEVMLDGLEFAKTVKDSDQFRTMDGHELASSRGVRRR